MATNQYRHQAEAETCIKETGLAPKQGRTRSTSTEPNSTREGLRETEREEAGLVFPLSWPERGRDLNSDSVRGNYRGAAGPANHNRSKIDGGLTRPPTQAGGHAADGERVMTTSDAPLTRRGDVTLLADAPSKASKSCKSCNVSNDDFLAAIFDTLPEGARPGIVSFPGNPAPDGGPKSRWFARPAPANTPHTANNYFGVSSYFNDDASQFRRTKKTFAALHAVMLDDLGTKVDMDRLPVSLRLSWLLETSPGNYQGGFILAEPVTDSARAEGLMTAIIDAGLCDPGANGPTARLARLPVAINGKRSPVFECKLTEWAPDRRYTVQALVDGLGLALPAAGRPKKTSAKSAMMSSRDDAPDDGVFIPAPDQNPVIAALKDMKLYKSPLGSGKHEITCPWCNEHTHGIDGGTAYFEPADGFPLGGFKCMHSHGDRLRIRDLLGLLSVQAAEARMKPTVRIQAGQIHRIVDRAERLLADSGRYYQSAGLVATVQTDPASDETAIVPVTQPALVRALSRVADWVKFDGREKAWVVADPPARHAGVLFDSSDYPHLPVLRGIARQPHLRNDGSVVTAAGYDTLTGRFGVFNARDYHIHEKPTNADAQAALARLDGLLDEVAFDTDNDRAAALSAMLTAACRPSLPTAPGFHVAAHTIGSGKSFLSRLISALATPQNVPGVAFPSNGDEMRKTLIALLIKSPAVVNFDDLNGDIVPSEALKTCMTEEFIGGRLLGVSKDVSCSTRTLFLFSGNNVGPVRDMARRVLTIHLDARCENPVARVFKRPHLEAEVRRDRALYVSAALVIIRAWIAAGAPHTEVKPVASYGRWADCCRQPLLWLGRPDPAERLFEQLAHDPDAELLGRMLTEWHAAHGSTPMLVRDVVRRAYGFDANGTDFAEVLKDIAEERGEINRGRLGWWIKHHQGRIINGLKFNSVSSARGATQWRVVQASHVLQVPVGATEKSVTGHDIAREVRKL